MQINAEFMGQASDIDYEKVGESTRADAIMAAHGTKAPEFELQVFALATQMLKGYRGGYWELYTVTLDPREDIKTALFMALPAPARQHVTSMNGFAYTLSGLEAGLVLCLFANNWLANKYAGRDNAASDRFSAQYDLLYQFALSRPDAEKILTLLD